MMNPLKNLAPLIREVRTANMAEDVLEVLNVTRSLTGEIYAWYSWKSCGEEYFEFYRMEG